MIRKRFAYGNQKIRERYERKDRRSLHISGAAGAASILLGLGKILSGITSLSFFICINGFYTLGMAAARYCALMGTVHADGKKDQYAYCRRSGYVMLFSSLLYIAYSLWIVFHPKETAFDKILALTIATITFTEIGINIYGVLKYRKSHTPLLHTLKTIGLGTSLISLVLTQSAILSFADDLQYPAVNGFLGTLMGLAAAMLGIYLIWRINKIEKEGGAEDDTYFGSR
ncbi:hypothetical protein [Anaerotignum sp.]